jgi:hypothetical protein
MSRNGLIAVVALGLLTCTTSGLSAHHSFAAEFDGTKKVILKGTITKIERVNPHGWIYIDVKAPDGKTENWAIETGSPNALAARGVKRDSLPIGVEVVVEGFRAKDGSNTASGSSIKLPDGRDLSLAPAGGSPDESKTQQ